MFLAVRTKIALDLVFLCWKRARLLPPLSFLMVVFLTLSLRIASQSTASPRASNVEPTTETQSPDVPTIGPDVPTIDKVELGIFGFWKIGYSTQTQVTVKASNTKLRGNVEIEAVDSDGVGVVYQKKCDVESGQSKTVLLMTRHGRSMRSMRVRFVDESGKRIVERLVTDHELGIMLPIGQPWVVGIGSGMDLDQAALLSAKGLLSTYSSCEIEDATRLPLDATGYQGVDLLVISTRDWKIVESLHVEQQTAIIEWVRRGGHVLLWIGENAEKFREAPWLSSLLPAEVKGTVKRVDPAVLESFLSSQKRLGELTCGHLVHHQGLVDLTLQSVDHQKFPLLLRSAFGFGQVHVCAADIDGLPIRNWPDRKLLLERLLFEHWDTHREERSQTLDKSDYLGYDDLAGQTRAALDVFGDVRTGSLTLLSVILFGFVALLGPFDYFVISKTWGRPAWTWFSLVLWSFSALVGITLLANSWKPSHHAVNSIELVDYDYSTGTLRGRAFAHHYAGRAGLFDFSASARETIPVFNSALSAPVQRVDSKWDVRTQLTWNGQPGHGLGGFDSNVRTDIGFSAYKVMSGVDSQDQVNAISKATDLHEVGIAYAATKSIRSDWNQSIILPSDNGTQLTVSGVSESLKGSWTNPMNEDLFDGWLMYRGWIYTLPTRMRANGVFQIPVEFPKDLGRRLQRKQIVKESDTSIPWDPTDRSDFGRIVEMLTLHRAAGGTGYTGLKHRYWGDLDLSQHLRFNRAIVFGRLANPVVKWSAEADEKPLTVQDGKRIAFARFVIPVKVINEAD